MLNFNDGEERLNKFSGSEKKTTILFDGTLYMLKYPDRYLKPIHNWS